MIGMGRQGYRCMGVTLLHRLEKTKKAATCLTCGQKTPNKMPSLPKVH